MKNNIEKYLLWACIFQVLAWFLPTVFPALANHLLIKSGMEETFPAIVKITLLCGLFTIPLKLVCGAWLKCESESLGLNKWIWFWTGFLLEFIGILLFYAYLSFCKKQGPNHTNIDKGQCSATA